MTIPAFACSPLGCRLAVAACVSRHAAATRAYKPGAPPLQSNACKTCVVGDAHTRGEHPGTWPDGSPIVRLELGMHHQAPLVGPPKPPERKAWTMPVRRDPTPENVIQHQPEESPMGRPAIKITFRGETMPLGQWAAKLGVHKTAIEKRRKATGSIEEALAFFADGEARKSPKAKAAPSRAATRAKPRRTPAAPSAPSEAATAVQSALSNVDPVELLRVAGWNPEVLGRAPRGRLVLIPDTEA